MSSYNVKVSSNGQVSIPAEVRRRWGAAKVLMIDRGDQIIMRPIPSDPLAAIIGKYADSAPPSEVIRQTARAEEAEQESRK